MQFRTLGLLSLFTTSLAVASTDPVFETRLLNTGALTLEDSQTLSVPLGKWAFVKKLVVRAEGIVHDARFQVIVNGDVKGTIFVPGADPSYIVTVNETANSIEFQSLNGRARIREIWVVEAAADGDRRPPLPDEGEVPIEARNKAAQYAKRGIELVDGLEPFSSFRDYGNYLLPIKKLAARTYAVAVAHSSTSAKVRQALIALRAQIVYASPYIETAYEVDAAFALAVELQSLKEKIEACLY